MRLFYLFSGYFWGTKSEKEDEILKTTSNLRFVFTHNVLSPLELLNRAHRVRTVGGDNYINAQNGLFFSSDGKDTLTLDQIYPIIVSAFTTDRRCFAKRRTLSSPLIKGVMKRK